MSKNDVFIWVQTSNPDYLKRYLGLRTNGQLKAFKKAFKAFTMQPDRQCATHRDRVAVLRDFKAYLARNPRR